MITYPTYLITPTRTNVGELARYWSELEKDDLIKDSFPKGDITTETDFINLAADPTTSLFLIYAEDLSLVAHFHFNGWSGKAAQAHFSVLKKLHGKGGIQMGRNVIQQIFAMRAPSGDPYIETLVGYTPTCNRLACRYAQKIGFEKVAVLSNGYTLKGGTLCDAMLSLARKS